MLQNIHNKAKGLFANILLSLIIITFVLWGVQGFIAARSIDNSVAMVNGDEISVSAFQNRLHSVITQVTQRYGDEAVNDPEYKKNLKSQLLQEMINEALVKQASEYLGLKIGDQQLRQEIEHIPAFQENGKFSEDLFQNFIQREDSRDIISGLQKELIERQLKSAFSMGAFIMPSELDRAIELFDERRDISFITIRANKQQAKIQPSEEALKKFYEAQKSRYEIPEKVSLQYVELDAKALKAKINIGDKEVETYYQDNIAHYQLPKRWRLAQLVIDSGSPKARAQVKEVQAKIKQGVDFAQLTKDYSADLITSQEGGDLGFLTEAMLTSEMKAALKTMKKRGDISDPYQNKQGYVFLKILKVEEAKQTPLAKVRDKIVNEIKSERVRKQYSSLAEQLANITFANPDTLEDAAKELDLPLKTTPAFTKDRGVDPISENKLVRHTAFTADVLEAGNNSDVLQVDQDTAIVIRILDHQLKKYVPFEKVKGELKTAMLDMQKREQVKTLAESLQAKLNKGEDIDATLKKHGMKWAQMKGVKRNSRALDRQLLQQAFQVNDREASVAFTNRGDAYLIKVEDIKPGTVKSVKEKQRKLLAQQLEAQSGSDAYRLYENYLRERAKIKINFNNLANVH